MFNVGDKVKCIEYENLYAKRTYTISSVFISLRGIFIVTVAEDKEFFRHHRADSFIIDLKENRKSKLKNYATKV